MLYCGLKTLNKLNAVKEAERLATKTPAIISLTLASRSGLTLLVEPNVFPIDFDPSNPV